MVNNYIEYMFNSILEASKGSDLLPFSYSDTFREMITDIDKKTNNEVAKRLLWEQGTDSNRIFIDIDRDSNDKISFLMSNKVMDVLGRDTQLNRLSFNDYDKAYNARQRGTMKINKFINALFNNEYETKKLTDEQKAYNKEKDIKTPSQHLEDFVNLYKSMRDPGVFELVSGSDISYWYHEDQYESANGTLGGSCMKEGYKNDYMDFYDINPMKVSMLVMKSKTDDKKTIGRALVWKLNTPSDRIFMDRIYTTNDYDVESFKKYAEDQGWLYKYKQNMDIDEHIVDDENNFTGDISMVVKDMIQPEDDIFPYLDTLKLYNLDTGILTNDDGMLPSGGKNYNLEGTDGDDHLKLSTLSYEELKEKYYEEIINNPKDFVVDYYPTSFWNHVDGEKFVKDFIKDQINLYIDDFNDVFDNRDELIIYIKNIADKEKIPNDLDELTIPELQKLMGDLGLKEQYSKYYTTQRYSGYSANDIYDEMVGSGSNDIDDDGYNYFNNYFDVEGFANDVKNKPTEYELREKYEKGQQ